MSGGKSLFGKGSPKPSSGSDEISAFLGKETFFEGKMTFQGVFRLDGKFEGEIFESGTLVVGESAHLKGKIEVKSIIINGQVEGDLHAKERVEIHSTGKFSGTLVTSSLVVQEGGFLNGRCQMETEVLPEKLFHPHLSPSDPSISVS